MSTVKHQNYQTAIYSTCFRQYSKCFSYFNWCFFRSKILIWEYKAIELKEILVVIINNKLSRIDSKVCLSIKTEHCEFEDVFLLASKFSFSQDVSILCVESLFWNKVILISTVHDWLSVIDSSCVSGWFDVYMFVSQYLYRMCDIWASNLTFN